MQIATDGKSYLLAVFGDEEIIRTMTPDFKILSQLDSRGLIITAPGEEVDFVSRFFSPQWHIGKEKILS